MHEVCGGTLMWLLLFGLVWFGRLVGVVDPHLAPVTLSMYTKWGLVMCTRVVLQLHPPPPRGFFLAAPPTHNRM
jgi:hypothetical protein